MQNGEAVVASYAPETYLLANRGLKRILLVCHMMTFTNDFRDTGMTNQVPSSEMMRSTHLNSSQLSDLFTALFSLGYPVAAISLYTVHRVRNSTKQVLYEQTLLYF